MCMRVILYCVCMYDSEDSAPGCWLSKALFTHVSHRLFLFKLEKDIFADLLI